MLPHTIRRIMLCLTLCLTSSSSVSRCASRSVPNSASHSHSASCCAVLHALCLTRCASHRRCASPAVPHPLCLTLTLCLTLCVPHHCTVLTLTLWLTLSVPHRAFSDSFYEYLLKLWLMGGKTDTTMRATYDAAVQGIHKRLINRSAPNRLAYLADFNGTHAATTMHHLSCFVPGMLALGAMSALPGSEGADTAARDLETAAELMQTCRSMFHVQPTGFVMISCSSDAIFLSVWRCLSVRLSATMCCLLLCVCHYVLLVAIYLSLLFIYLLRFAGLSLCVACH